MPVKYRVHYSEYLVSTPDLKKKSLTLENLSPAKHLSNGFNKKVKTKYAIKFQFDYRGQNLPENTGHEILYYTCELLMQLAMH